jgi:cell fate regulator YaaT (PSP1 superfamily)
MPYVATCVFREPAKSYYLDPCDLELHADSRIVAETARGIELGKLKFLPREVSEDAILLPLRPIYESLLLTTSNSTKLICAGKKKPFF